MSVSILDGKRIRARTVGVSAASAVVTGFAAVAPSPPTTDRDRPPADPSCLFSSSVSFVHPSVRPSRIPSFVLVSVSVSIVVVVIPVARSPSGGIRAKSVAARRCASLPPSLALSALLFYLREEGGGGGEEASTRSIWICESYRERGGGGDILAPAYSHSHLSSVHLNIPTTCLRLPTLPSSLPRIHPRSHKLRAFSSNLCILEIVKRSAAL